MTSRAVMDAAGSERAALVGFSEGGPMSMSVRGVPPRAHGRPRPGGLLCPPGMGTGLSLGHDNPDIRWPQRTHPRVMGRWHLYFVVLSERQGR